MRPSGCLHCTRPCTCTGKGETACWRHLLGHVSESGMTGDSCTARDSTSWLFIMLSLSWPLEAASAAAAILVSEGILERGGGMHCTQGPVCARSLMSNCVGENIAPTNSASKYGGAGAGMGRAGLACCCAVRGLCCSGEHREAPKLALHGGAEAATVPVPRIDYYRLHRLRR